MSVYHGAKNSTMIIWFSEITESKVSEVRVMTSEAKANPMIAKRKMAAVLMVCFHKILQFTFQLSK
jgi:hypothetical protein